MLATVIATTRFGSVEVPAGDLIHFPEGLVGLPGNEYGLIGAERGPFTWLQSLTEPEIALPLTDPRRFFPNFTLDISESEGHRLSLEPGETTEIFVTVRATAVATDCTANLRAPILVRGPAGSGPRSAHQVLNQAPGAALRVPLFSGALI
ncbi:flagellar assembly protein FliW [Conexibacter sp. DBS9H8]|uniref:flagellar assembly protein FliW n=1 Tax=Conexibacter sp. DBS9H8 TaxID=2937801 RepID=UPI00200BAC4F|nr:flagellar assembly protein FliW [Conexibacter sp. DBS9H8]